MLAIVTFNRSSGHYYYLPDVYAFKKATISYGNKGLTASLRGDKWGEEAPNVRLIKT